MFSIAKIIFFIINTMVFYLFLNFTAKITKF